MLVSIIPIGNSKGIRIPKNILQQLNIGEKVEMKVHEKEILIRPVEKEPRKDWAEAFSEMHENSDDILLIESLTEQDDFEWEW